MSFNGGGVWGAAAGAVAPAALSMLQAHSEDGCVNYAMINDGVLSD